MHATDTYVRDLLLPGAHDGTHSTAWSFLHLTKPPGSRVAWVFPSCFLGSFPRCFCSSSSGASFSRFRLDRLFLFGLRICFFLCGSFCLLFGFRCFLFSVVFLCIFFFLVGIVSFVSGNLSSFCYFSCFFFFSLCCFS